MSVTESELANLAERLLDDYDAVRPGELFADGLRLELVDAWRLQSAVAQLRTSRGERVAGYKVGAVNAGNQQMLGVTEPVWGRLWESEFHESGVQLEKSTYANLAIEAEFGIVLSKDVEPGMGIEELAACVDALYPTLELHNLKFESEQPHGPELVANNCINCGVVKGKPVTQLKESQMTNLKLVFDGQVVDAWDNLAWPHDILAAVDWLSNSLMSQGLRLQRGDFVLTSAWGPPLPVENHARIDVTSSVFGNVFADII